MASTAQTLLASLLLLSCLALSTHATILFDDLKHSLVVTASPKEGEVLKAGENNITVTWAMNSSFPAGTNSDYKSIQVKLCYAPISQVDRAWRKTEEKLKKDKTCQFKIVTRPFNPSNNTVQSIVWTVERDVPTASFFVRAYVKNSEGHEVAYGQSTDEHKTTNIFTITSISGRHVSMDIASVCFSVFSIVSLAFFLLSKRGRERGLSKCV